RRSVATGTSRSTRPAPSPSCRPCWRSDDLGEVDGLDDPSVEEPQLEGDNAQRGARGERYEQRLGAGTFRRPPQGERSRRPATVARRALLGAGTVRKGLVERPVIDVDRELARTGVADLAQVAAAADDRRRQGTDLQVGGGRHG